MAEIHSTTAACPQPDASAVAQAIELCEAIQCTLTSIEEMARQAERETSDIEQRSANALADAIGHMARICYFKADLALTALGGSTVGWSQVADCLEVPKELLGSESAPLRS